MFLIVPEGVLGSVLTTFWTPFGVLWGSQVRPGEVLGVSWRVWEHLEGSWGGFGRPRGLLGVLLGCLGALLVVLNGGIMRVL